MTQPLRITRLLIERVNARALSCYPQVPHTSREENKMDKQAVYPHDRIKLISRFIFYVFSPFDHQVGKNPPHKCSVAQTVQEESRQSLILVVRSLSRSLTPSMRNRFSDACKAPLISIFSILLAKEMTNKHPEPARKTRSN